MTLNLRVQKGYQNIVTTPYAAVPANKNFPHGNLLALTVKFKSYEGREYELILRSDNVVFDIHGELWIIDPH